MPPRAHAPAVGCPQKRRRWSCTRALTGHYTGHFKAVVTKPQNVYVLKDIMANGYRAGGNCKFFCPDGNFADGKRNLQKRLNFEDDEDSLPSMFAFPASAQQLESGKLDTAFSVTQRLLPYEVTQQKHEHFPGGENMHMFYMQKLGLNAVHFGEDMRATENMEFISQVRRARTSRMPTHTRCHRFLDESCFFACAQGTTNNALCFLGPHRKFSPIAGTDGAYTALVPGQGHWGPDARPGDVRATILERAATPSVFLCAFFGLTRMHTRLYASQARWRRGESVSMQSAREQMLTYARACSEPLDSARSDCAIRN
jgi:hypothetical protein